MSKTHSIVLDIFKNLHFSDEELLRVEHCFKKINLKKGDLLLKANETVLHQYYVQSGCLRTYYIDHSGKEHTLQFAIHDWWASDFTGLFTASKGILHIECIEDATLYQISRVAIDKLYTEIPQLETFFRKKMEIAFGSFQMRILSNLSQSASERYVNFINTYPNIDQSIKNYHLASYLGITTESLSRIRKELANS